MLFQLELPREFEPLRLPLMKVIPEIFEQSKYLLFFTSQKYKEDRMLICLIDIPCRQRDHTVLILFNQLDLNIVWAEYISLGPHHIVSNLLDSRHEISTALCLKRIVELAA